MLVTTAFRQNDPAGQSWLAKAPPRKLAGKTWFALNWFWHLLKEAKCTVGAQITLFLGRVTRKEPGVTRFWCKKPDFWTVVAWGTLYTFTFLAVEASLALFDSELCSCALLVISALIKNVLSAYETIFADLRCRVVPIDWFEVLRALWTVEAIGAWFHVLVVVKRSWW